MNRLLLDRAYCRSNRRMGASGMRRALRGGGSAFAHAAPLTLVGHKDWTTSNYQATANPGGIAGTDTPGFWVSALITLDSQAVASGQRQIVQRHGGNGWALRVDGTNASLFGGFVNSALAFVYTPSIALTAGMVGQTHVATIVHDGSFVRLYWDQAEVGSGTAITGFNSVSGPMNIGSRPGFYAADGWTIHGIAGGHAVPSLAQVQAHHAACKAALAMVADPAVTTQDFWNADLTGDSFVSDSGTDDATKTGAALTAVTTTTPTWGF